MYCLALYLRLLHSLRINKESSTTEQKCYEQGLRFYHKNMVPLVEQHFN